MRGACAARTTAASGRTDHHRAIPAILGGVLRNVAVAACDGVAPFELGVLCEVFGLDRTAQGLPGYDFAVCAIDPPPLRTKAGFLIDTPHGLDRLAEADL